MPRSNKANLPWIDAVGSEVVERLADRYARPMIFRQSGPYNQNKTPYGGIYFNDPILHYISPTKPGHTVDFRFGFCLQRYFASNLNSYIITSGFEMLNPTLSIRLLMPNIRAERDAVASKLSHWLRFNSGYVRMGIKEGADYRTFANHDLSELGDALKAYTTLPRNHDSLTWRRLQIVALRDLTQFDGWEEADLLKNAGDVAAAALASFEQLDFLYSLLFPRDLSPTRLSNGQNRALKTRQPDRCCAWAVQDHCVGSVDAAHIKPDRLGGHAVPGNLFWLCKFHHKLLDTYLNASLEVDRSTKQIVASVGMTPPAQSKAGGVPLAIWEAIVNKRVWILPLNPQSISHLFT